MIKCITFDLDDTLWEIEPVIIKAEIKFEEWLKPVSYTHLTLPTNREV